MFRKNQLLLAVTFVFFFVANIFSQDIPADRVIVPFSDPSKPGLLKASLINGSITIKGYNGKEVIIEASSRTKKYSRRDSNDEYKGMKRISITATGLTVEEEDNVMKVGASSHMRTIDLNIQVPLKTSLDISTVNSGDIDVENIEGEVEVNNTNGHIQVLNIAGTVLANTTNGKVVVTFNKIAPDKPMSFVSFNGNVDVTLLSATKANLKMKSEQGEIYSDFDIALEEKSRVITDDASKKGRKFRVRVESAMYGAINGGGPEFRFSTYNGNIYIRKAK